MQALIPQDRSKPASLVLLPILGFAVILCACLAEAQEAPGVGDPDDVQGQLPRSQSTMTSVAARL